MNMVSTNDLSPMNLIYWGFTITIKL